MQPATDAARNDIGAPDHDDRFRRQAPRRLRRSTPRRYATRHRTTRLSSRAHLLLSIDLHRCPVADSSADSNPARPPRLTTQFVSLAAGFHLGLPPDPASQRSRCLRLGASTTTPRGLPSPTNRPCRTHTDATPLRAVPTSSRDSSIQDGQTIRNVSMPCRCLDISHDSNWGAFRRTQTHTARQLR